MTRSNQFNRLKASTPAKILVALALLVSPIARVQAQATAGAMPNISAEKSGKIRGIVFDSLLMAPIKSATVTLMSRMESVTSDEKGAFSFDNVPVGAQTIVFDSDELDSLGLGTMGSTIQLREGETARVTLTTSSLQTLWKRRCAPGTALSPDSGIVWGTIRHARDNKLANDAVVAFSWYDLRIGTTPGVYVSDVRKEILTDNDGTFFACGVPTEIVITTAAIDTSTTRGKAASGFLEYAVGSRRLQRLDLTISPDMIAPPIAAGSTHEDSAAASRARGRATVKGVVLDDRKRPVANAIVGVPSADTSVTTGENGTFVIGGLPAGTHAVQTRRIGFAPVSQIASLHTDSITEISVISAAVNVVDVYNVRATIGRGADRSAFESRRKLGLGAYAESKDFTRRMDMAAVLSAFPGLLVRRNGSDLIVTTGSMMRSSCAPAVFLDGTFSSIQVVSTMRPADFKAIEVYARASAAPLQYSTFSQCGVILFWSNNVRW